MADGGEHAALLELEASAHRDVQQLAGTSLADKARSQQLSAGIQDKMARIRALTRDLELEVEELDGWGRGGCWANLRQAGQDGRAAAGCCCAPCADSFSTE